MNIKVYVAVFLGGFFYCPLLAQNLIYQPSNPQITRENWLDIGLQQWNTDQRKKGFFKCDSLYLVSHKDSLGAMVSATPVFTFWAGKEIGQDGWKHQNSRGLLITGGYKRFSCFAMIMENQAFLPKYQTLFIESHGEFYPGSNAYTQQNGMVPGGGRTKPFKTSGFDYAYSQGSMQWEISKRISLIGGNGNLRLGDGFRSLFWSNHNQVPLIGGSIKINPHLQYLFMKGRLFDLIRKPKYANVESPYYKKGYSMNALIYSHKKYSAGVVYQTIWEGGDSIRERPVSSWYWIPLPGLDGLAKNRVSLPQWGVVGRIEPIPNFVIYGEGFLRGFEKKALSYQLGINFQPILTTSLTLRLNMAFLRVGDSFYGENYALSFTSNNLPLGSLMGNGTRELLFAGRLGYKRLYVDLILQYYTASAGKNILFKEAFSPENQVVHGVVEMGFMVNPAAQCVIFSLCDLRYGKIMSKTMLFTFGVKTALFPNHHVY